MATLKEKSVLLEKEFNQAVAAVREAPSESAVEEFRIHWLGRKGLITGLFDELKNASREEKPEAGKALNIFRKNALKQVDELKKESVEFSIREKLSADKVDITLPVNSSTPSGSLHPVTLMRSLLLNEFRRMGFSVFDGPELDHDFYNFSALNIAEHHPARDMQDTFFVEGKSNMVLRTHTSNIQIHAMLRQPPPIRLVAPGRVYRVDSDATHTPMFHQLECVVVDKGISFGHLKGIIDRFMKSVFGSDLNTRLRPSFFPFVEPGAEIDLQCTMCRGKGCKVCSHTGWLEIGGCGMIHPNVFESVQYDSEDYTGFAFGFGIDRMAMLAYGLPDLRQLFEGDYSFHTQFPIYS